MVKKIITWVDLQGRYRVTSPSYESLALLFGFDEDDALNWTWTNIVAVSKYGITFNHPFSVVEDVDQRLRLTDIAGVYFRYGVFLTRDARDGAWEMDVDGRPKVNMVRARGIQMDYIRITRNSELKRLDELQVQALGQGNNADRASIEVEKQTLRDIPQTFDLSGFTTPPSLKAAWPAELPVRGS